MNKVKKTTLWGRLKAAARSLKGTPVSTLTVGLEIKRCDECARGDCTKCDYKQEFDKLMALPNCNDCGARACCFFSPRVGSHVRINCPLWSPEKGTEVTKE